MPSFESRTSLDLTRDLKLFLDLRFGVTRAGTAGAEAAFPKKAVGLETVNSRNAGASTLLVSFCNVKDRSKPFVAAVDLLADPPEVRWLQINEGIFFLGATGLCFWDGLVCVAHQQGPENPPGFVLLDPELGFEQVGRGALPTKSGVHSACSREDGIYFVMALKDSVYKATRDERSGEWEVSRYWILPESSGESDQNHLNAIDIIDGDLCISGFGGTESGAWVSAKGGFIYNVDREEYVARDVYHPHSLLRDSGATWYCESARRRVRSSGGEEIELPPGYIRGLAVSSEYLYVGSSKTRKFSESTGCGNRSWEYEGTCCVYRLPKGSSEPEVLVDFSGSRNEIYELLLV